MTNYIERYWRDATPQDAIREPPMLARFRDDGDEGWLAVDILLYHDRSMHPWHNNDGINYERCQVYDAPDPGEGWRLVDPDKEQPEEHDEYLCPVSKFWCFCTEYLRRVSYSKDSIIRRRIEPPKPKYEPFGWEDREQLRGRWYTVTLSCGEIRECQIEFLRLYRNMFYIGSFVSEELLEKNARFLDTGEPVGRRVE